MNLIYPFSEFNELARTRDFSLGSFVDTNLLIATLYETHPFNEVSSDLFMEIAQRNLPLYTTVTVRTEYLDFIRRLTITERLMELLSEASSYRLSERVKAELKKHKQWMYQEEARGNLPVLTDARIKSCKQVFEPLKHSGNMGWLHFCSMHLSGSLLKQWSNIEKSFGINYLQLRGSESEEFLNKPIEWGDMFSISEKTGASSSDSMILNAFFTSKFQSIFSADWDVAYAVAAEKNPEKICFVPDSLYRQIRKLAF